MGRRLPSWDVKQNRALRGALFLSGKELDPANNVAEDVADRGPQEGENDNDDNGDEYEDQRVLN